MIHPQNTLHGTEKQIFMAALEFATPAERAAFLHSACGEDAVLRRRVELLLATHFAGGNFMREPAAVVVAAGPAGASRRE